MKAKLFLVVLFFLNSFSEAREGMWMPQLLKELNESEMRSMGMQLSADDIYSINHSSIKDAVLQFGGGCTGEVISESGLLITNHHCGFSQIQSLSSIEKNYLDNGFWSKDSSEEIPCPGLTVTFIKEITEITNQILKDINDTASEDSRNAIIKSRIDTLEKSFTGSYKGFVRAFYAGNKYYLFKTEVFSDIRFVGAPPKSIGKFGGETDNWMWPRHTGDFALFRIYADKNNSPAAYSKDNIQYKSKEFLKINIGGVKEKDFVFVLGFPGKTQRYLPSGALKVVEEQTNPNRIEIREARLNVLRKSMAENDTVRLKYVAKFSTLENPYKKWKGELLGFRKFDVVKQKKNEQDLFKAELIKKGKKKESEVVDNFNKLSEQTRSLNASLDYFAEAFPGIELLSAANKCKVLIDLCGKDSSDTAAISKEVIKVKADLTSFFKNYDRRADEKLCKEILKLTLQKLDSSFVPGALADVNSNESSLDKYISNLYMNSYFTDPEKVFQKIKNKNCAEIKQLSDDPAYRLAMSISMSQKKLSGMFENYNKQIARTQREYQNVILQNSPGEKLFPDANSTLRVSYGRVEGMNPVDGTHYNYYTTADGIIQKNLTGEDDYKIPERLKELIIKKDYGNYAKDNVLPVAFMTSSHTTGGNSGSPALNAKGELMGLNYDRIWEGVLSDYYYNEAIARNICLDIRYALFIIEKYGDCKRLINEMTIIGD